MDTMYYAVCTCTPKICKLYALSPKRHLDLSFEFLSSKRHCQIRSDEGDRYACLLLPRADRFLFLNTTDPTTNRRKRILFCLLLGHKVVMSLRLSDPSPIFFSKLRLIVSNCWKKSSLCLLGTCDLIRAPCPCLTGLKFFKFNNHH